MSPDITTELVSRESDQTEFHRPLQKLDKFDFSPEIAIIIFPSLEYTLAATEASLEYRDMTYLDTSSCKNAR